MSFSCESARRLVLAYVDGELVGDEKAFFESHVERCEACRYAIRDEVALGHALDRALPRDRAPEDLRARVEALFDAAPRARGLPRRWAVASAAAVALTAVVGGYAMGRRSPAVSAPAIVAVSPPSYDLAALAADTHLRYTRGQLPLEIDSDRPEAVSHWFSGRVPFNLALPDYVGPGEQKFHRLQGGRLVSFAGDYAAYVAYRMDEHPISLIVTSAAQARPEGGETVQFRSLVFHQQAVQGLKVITWTDKGLTYALASDLSVRKEQSCLVCHGSPQDRPLIEGFADRPRS